MNSSKADKVIILADDGIVPQKQNVGPNIVKISIDEHSPAEKCSDMSGENGIFKDRDKCKSDLNRAYTVVKLLVLFNCLMLLCTIIITCFTCRKKFNASLKISEAIR